MGEEEVRVVREREPLESEVELEDDDDDESSGHMSRASAVLLTSPRP